MDLIFAATGLVLLVFAGDMLVRGAVNLALRLGIPALIVSLTIVSFGTSAPELFIAVGAVLEGAPGIAIGNVVGSNTANILLVLGVPALFFGISTRYCNTGRSYLFMMIASLWFIALSYFGPLTWVHGLLMLGVLTAILLDQARAARAHVLAGPDDSVEGADPSMPWWRIFLYLSLGLAGLPLGAHFLVNSAVNIATDLGVSETVIGLTLVAVGTSLPELATTIAAAMRRQADVALGNVIGSNMFNLLAIIGVASMFGDIPIEATFLNFDLWVMLAASVVLAPFVLMRFDMGRIVGLVFTALYIGYLLLALT